ncbi:methyltransferase-like protein 6-like protein [Rhizophagus irregularis]|uniref:tRNA N(3)-methylcytidine methyltransferase n=1 Tax=Rhizophagus irregularis TaxID=588596 RepID=A0A2N0Q8I0_9GLOM|nr:methyltransferase-like protein 6-like protein [Rhizophagus irregularis]CAB4489409.1 unnamed protein product [Rhizophagus irregularis]CAB5182938.1 unnamed protein product [Rhizophagus irregularis]CAB5368501.1 unnamed protein product [Rhizophagus irregularis]
MNTVDMTDNNDSKQACPEIKTIELKIDYEKIEELLKNDKKLLPQFWANKYKNDASKNWDLFYKRNTTKFFKNRHWIGREFNELSFNNNEQDSELNNKKIVLELGCGVGNFIFPVLESNPLLFIYACDFSKRAIEFVKNHFQYDEKRCNAFVCDLTEDNLPDFISSNDKVNIVSSIFVLSAIPPEKHLNVIRNISKVTKQGSIICFRDYAIYDETQLKFSSDGAHKLDENLYVRQDGTMSYFFTIEYLKDLFEKDGLFQMINGEYVEKETINRAKELRADRRFLQAKFIRL